MHSTLDPRLIEFLSSFVTPERLKTMKRVLNLRTDYLAVVLEDIFQPHNASAVLRSCDAFGLQDVHIIENRNTYRVNPGVSLGSSQWLTLHRYDSQGANTKHALEHLKNEGYRIVATTPHRDDVDLEDFDIAGGKAALFFGTEMHGLSDEVLAQADVFLKIPMYGFVESYNISVSCAVILHTLTYTLRHSDLPWKVDENRKNAIFLDWLRASLKKSELYEKKFYDKTPFGGTIQGKS